MAYDKPYTFEAKHPDGRIIVFDDYVEDGDEVGIFTREEYGDEREDEMVWEGPLIVFHTFDDGWILRELTEEEHKERNRKILGPWQRIQSTQ